MALRLGLWERTARTESLEQSTSAPRILSADVADAIEALVEAAYGGILFCTHVGTFRVITAQLAERPHLVTADRVHARNPVLDAVNVKAALGQLDLLPLQVAHRCRR